jgi:Rod binding domain-containing protein
MDVRDSLGALPQIAPMDLLGLGAHRPETAAVSPTPRTGHAAGAPMSQRDIDHVSEGFDAMFASLLIKQMRESMDTGSMFGHDAGDVLGGLFDQFMGDHFAKAGGLGIGKMVKHQLQQQAFRQAAGQQILAQQSAGGSSAYAAQAAIARANRSAH